MHTLTHIAGRLFNTPLLIHRAKLDAILAVLGPRVGWPEAKSAVPVPAPRASSASRQGDIAVIPIHGTLVRRALGLEAASGLASYQEIGAQIDRAVADPAVAGIVLDIDSPGGEAGGVFELAERIRAATREKPVWAVANDQAFSAAYALAAASDEVFVTRTGGVGSIGVIAMHADQSRKDEQDGYRFTAIYAGSHKNDFSPHAPLSDDARSALQAEVDRLYGIFTESVAQHRGLTVEAVRETEARLYFGGDAVAAGLADRVGTLADAVSAMRAELDPPIHTNLPQPQEAPTMEHHDPDPAACEPVVADPTEPEETRIAAAVEAARNEARAIADLCLLAGCPEKTAGFLAQGMTQEAVREALLEYRAQAPEIASHIDPQRTSPAASLDDNPVVAAARKRAAKEV
jgi:signal peptide peptidase SppA